MRGPAGVSGSAAYDAARDSATMIVNELECTTTPVLLIQPSDLLTGALIAALDHREEQQTKSLV